MSPADTARAASTPHLHMQSLASQTLFHPIFSTPDSRLDDIGGVRGSAIMLRTLFALRNMIHRIGRS